MFRPEIAIMCAGDPSRVVDRYALRMLADGEQEQTEPGGDRSSKLTVGMPDLQDGILPCERLRRDNAIDHDSPRRSPKTGLQCQRGTFGLGPTLARSSASMSMRRPSAHVPSACRS